MAILRDIITAFEQKVPLQLSLEGDHNGLKIGSRDKEIHRVIGCLELTNQVIDYAIAKEIDCIFVHHDPMYFPLYAVDYDNAHTAKIVRLIQHNIALYVAHTNLDIVADGLNDYIFEKLGGVDGKALETRENVGRYGKLATSININDYIKKYVAPLQPSYRLITNNQHRLIKKIGVVNGSGASYFKLAAAKKIDVYITGDVDYHTAMLARDYDITIIDIGHDIEYLVHDVFARILHEIDDEHGFDLQVFNKKDFDFTPW